MGRMTTKDCCEYCKWIPVDILPSCSQVPNCTFSYFSGNLYFYSTVIGNAQSFLKSYLFVIQTGK